MKSSEGGTASEATGVRIRQHVQCIICVIDNARKYVNRTYSDVDDNKYLKVMMLF